MYIYRTVLKNTLHVINDFRCLFCGDFSVQIIEFTDNTITYSKYTVPKIILISALTEPFKIGSDQGWEFAHLLMSD